MSSLYDGSIERRNVRAVNYVRHAPAPDDRWRVCGVFCPLCEGGIIRSLAVHVGFYLQGSFERDEAVPGERDLETLLQNMKPEMHEGVFVFCTIPESEEIPATIRPMHIFREREGTAFVVPREKAESVGLPYQFSSRLITLDIHSSLEAVGFLAAITTRLAEAGISVNPVAAFYHDHLFVPDHRAVDALHHLRNMSLPHSG